MNEQALAEGKNPTLKQLIACYRKKSKNIQLLFPEAESLAHACNLGRPGTSAGQWDATQVPSCQENMMELQAPDDGFAGVHGSCRKWVLTEVASN
ncbi:uncharacterized protein AAES06_007738 [Glossophaga mutica]